MIGILFSTLLTSFIILISGRVITSKDKNNKYLFFDTFILGFIFLSFLPLFINFFLPLSKSVNSICILIIFLYILYKKRLDFSKKDITYLLLISFLSSLMLVFSDSYRPDAGIYHYPYINVLNNEKIVIGLFNVHQRFAHISIIQYTSAFFNNFIIGQNGIVIPLASISSAIIVYFFKTLINLKSLKSFGLLNLFSFFVIIYISFKMNRYSEFGNDALGHFLYFYLISFFILNFKSKDKFFEIFIICIFIFLNKVSFILSFCYPLFYLAYNKVELIKLRNFKNVFASFFLLCWLLKNILVSGCLIYPVNSTCFDDLKWSNSNRVEKSAIGIEAFAKGLSDQKDDEYINAEKFRQNFNWLTTWYNGHFKKIIFKNLGIYLLISLIASILLFYKVRSKKNYTKIKFDSYEIILIKLIFVISFLGSLIWFLKFPTYRFGYSYLISSIIFLLILFIFYAKKNISHINRKSLNFLLITFFLVISFKQVVRIYEKFDIQYNNYPWTKYFSMSEDNYSTKNIPYYKNGIIILRTLDKNSNQNCNLSKPICSPEHEIDKKIRLEKLGKYKVYFVK